MGFIYVFQKMRKRLLLDCAAGRVYIDTDRGGMLIITCTWLISLKITYPISRTNI